MKSGFVLIILFALILAACVNNPAGRKPVIRVKKKVSLIRPDDSATYTYSADSRITSQHLYPSNTLSTFEYSTEKVVEHRNSPSPHVITYFLNPKGQAESMVINQDTFSYYIYYSYDEDGINIGEASDVDKRTPEIIRTVENRNVVKAVNYNNGGEYEVSYYEYYLDTPNVLALENSGYTFWGKDSKDLLKRYVMVRNGKDTAYVNFHRYHFDDKGRVSIDAVYGKSGALSDSVQYFY